MRIIIIISKPISRVFISSNINNTVTYILNRINLEQIIPKYTIIKLRIISIKIIQSINPINLRKDIIYNIQPIRRNPIIKPEIIIVVIKTVIRKIHIPSSPTIQSLNLNSRIRRVNNHILINTRLKHNIIKIHPNISPIDIVVIRRNKSIHILKLNRTDNIVKNIAINVIHQIHILYINPIIHTGTKIVLINRINRRNINNVYRINNINKRIPINIPHTISPININRIISPIKIVRINSPNIIRSRRNTRSRNIYRSSRIIKLIIINITSISSCNYRTINLIEHIVKNIIPQFNIKSHRTPIKLIHSHISIPFSLNTNIGIIKSICNKSKSINTSTRR